MPQDGTGRSGAPKGTPKRRRNKQHPQWCDLSVCTIADDGIHGMHQSASQVVPADPPCDTVVEMHFNSRLRGMDPDPLLTIEFDYDDGPRDNEDAREEYIFALTVHQMIQLRDSLHRLIASVAT
jgi:hypothetical protein